MRYFIVSLIVLFFCGFWLLFRSFINKIDTRNTPAQPTTPATALLNSPMNSELTTQITEAKNFQRDFCANFEKYEDKSIEDLIRIKSISLRKANFDMYMYENNDIVSTIIYNTGGWEMDEVIELENAVESLHSSDFNVISLGA